MGLVKMSSLVSDISGGIGSLQFARTAGNRIAVYEKTRKRYNPQSVKQQLRRTQVSTISKLWRSALTDAQRNTWEQYAKTTPKHQSRASGIIRTPHGILSGFDAFIRNNLNLYSAEIRFLPTYLQDAPLGITPPTPPLNVSATFNPVTEYIMVTWTRPTIIGARIRVWARSKSVKLETQIARTALGTAIQRVIWGLNGAKGNQIGWSYFFGKVDIQLDTVDQYGQPSEPSNVFRGLKVFVP